jgi:hypothetical protein
MMGVVQKGGVLEGGVLDGQYARLLSAARKRCKTVSLLNSLWRDVRVVEEAIRRLKVRVAATGLGQRRDRLSGEQRGQSAKALVSAFIAEVRR